MSTTRPGRKGKSPRSPAAENVPVDDDSGISNILAGFEAQGCTSPVRRTLAPPIAATTVGDFQNTGSLFDMEGGGPGSSTSPATTTSFAAVEDIIATHTEETAADKADKSSKDSSSSDSGSQKGSEQSEEDDGAEADGSPQRNPRIHN